MKRRCRNSKGRFTKCRGRSSGLSGVGRKTRCAKGRVTRGPRKGRCRK